MRRLTATCVLLTASAVLPGCPTPMPDQDAAPDVQMTTGDASDASSPDVVLDGTADVRPDTQASDVVGDAGTCRSLPLEDLSVLGTRNGNTTQYRGDNSGARDSTTLGLQPPTGQTVCAFLATRQRVFTYVLRADAALVVSTSNPGTDPTFDTTISVATGQSCTASTRPSWCNDDDPSMAGAKTSRLTTGTLRAGTRVFIAVGGYVNQDGSRIAAGEQGTFDLTVQELAPVADGAACDTAGQMTVCGVASSCVASVILGTMGTCRANGSVAGAACDASNNCASPLSCDSTAGRCYATVADGMDCQRFTDAWQRCGADSTCVNLQRGSVFGVCRANGSAAGAACNASGMCPTAGLSCYTSPSGTTSLCLNAATTGAACRTWDSVCPTGENCVATTVGGTPGTCRAAGTAPSYGCTSTMTCTAPLTCNTPADGSTPVCANAAMSGAACGLGLLCPTNDTCYLTDPADRYRGICRTPGTLDGNCRTTGAACDTGLVCTDTMTPANGRCQRMGTVGGMCRIFGDVTCPSGSSCVRSGGTGLNGTCLAAGTGPGAACRTTGTQCDGALQCSAMTGSGLCQTQLTAGAACDPRFGTNRCPMNQWCQMSTIDTGTCGATTAEAEPNDALAMAQRVTGRASIAGALARFDLDCYRVTVAANGSLVARANASSGFCYSGTTTTLSLDVYDANGRLLGGDSNSGSFGCPRIDSRDPSGNFAWASMLPAGDYSVCVRNRATGGAAIPNYVLDLFTL